MSSSRIRVGRFFFVLATILGVLLAEIAVVGQSSGDRTETIRGTVVNSVTHEPIARALVYSPDNRYARLTDDEGHFEFSFPKADATLEDTSNIADRPSILLARRIGYLNNDISGTVTNDMTITLVPEALIVGKVSLPSSEPPDRIQVEIYRRGIQDGRAHWALAMTKTTKSNGEFRFAELAAGVYKVLTRELLDRDPLTFDPRGQLYGYPPVYFPSATGFVSAADIHLTAGETAQANLTLARQPYYSVKIPVANAQRGFGFNVNVFLTGHRGPGYSLGYNGRTQSIEGSLPTGNYTVEASSFGANNVSLVGSQEITVRGAAIAGPAMVMNPAGSVSAVVKEEFSADQTTDTAGGGVAMGFSSGISSGRRSQRNRPSNYLSVLMEPADDFGQQQTQSFASQSSPNNDSLVLEHVAPGRYWVRVITSRGYVASVRSGSDDLQQRPLEIGAGGAVSPIEITVRDDAASISGTVEGIASPPASDEAQPGSGVSIRIANPPAPAHVYCIPTADSDGTFTEVWVGPDGSFQSPPMAPGAYRLLAFDQPQRELEYRNPEAMRNYDSKGPTIRLSAGQKENVRVPLITTE